MKKFKISNCEKEYTITKTIRIKKSLIEKVEDIANLHNISVNKLIIDCRNFALENIDESTNNPQDTNK